MPNSIQPLHLAEKIAGGHSLFLLDVRQPWENEAASIQNSVLIPLGELVSRIGEIDPPDDSAIVVYCHHGIRSQNAAAVLEQAGFREVFSLTGGIDAWSCEVDPSVPRY